MMIEKTTTTIAYAEAAPYRKPPPIDCCSSQFLFYLNSTVADSAFQAWSHLVPRNAALFPPERFHFDVLELD